MTIQTLVDYVVAHRRKKAFEGWSPIEIAEAFLAAVEDRTLVFSVDGMGKVNGVAHATRHVNNKVIYVCNVLTTERGVLKRLLRWLREMYPECRVEARRHGRIVRYNTSKLYNKFNIA